MTKALFDALVAYVEASELRAAYRAQSTMQIDGPAWDRINGELLKRRAALFKLMVTAKGAPPEDDNEFV